MIDSITIDGKTVTYVGGFMVRVGRGKPRAITSGEMAAFTAAADEAFASETCDGETCCGGSMTDSGFCGKFPRNRCVYFVQATELLGE